MELKNAVTICLITLFSATLVVLIARALDNQAASRLEPQLAQIVAELRALRSQGGIVTAAGAPGAAETLEDGLIVYYFHGDIRCPTCRAIESQTREVVENDFADHLKIGKIVWKVLNYDKPESAKFASEFDVHMANVVLAKIDDGKIQNWQRLDQVWALHGNKSDFANFIRTEISQMLVDEDTDVSAAEESNALGLPVPEESPQPVTQGQSPTGLPLPE